MSKRSPKERYLLFPINEVGQEDYAVEIPTVMGDIEDYEMFDNFERIEKW